MGTKIMLDLETLGTKPGSVIVAIGAVKFDERGIFDCFYSTVDPASCERFGMKIEASTVMWWMKQSEAARAEFEGPAPIIEVVLESFATWLGSEPVEEMWGNGAAFDNVLLADAYDMVGIKRPWDYKADRCYRTIKNLHRSLPFVKEGLAHHALHDARSQAKHLLQILHGTPLPLSDEQKDGPGPDMKAGWEKYRRHLLETAGCRVPGWDELPTEVQECFCAGVWEALEGASPEETEGTTGVEGGPFRVDPSKHGVTYHVGKLQTVEEWARDSATHVSGHPRGYVDRFDYCFPKLKSGDYTFEQLAEFAVAKDPESRMRLAAKLNQLVGRKGIDGRSWTRKGKVSYTYTIGGAA